MSDWLCAQSALWFVVEGELDEAGMPVNLRPLVTHHPSGATVSLVFTDESRAQRYRERLNRGDEQLFTMAATPAEGFAALLALPIEGITINPGDADHLNAGRRQLAALADQARGWSSSG